jgi:hypothetical protein
MTYSRWSNSNWYSFHVTGTGDDSASKDEQVLSLWHCMDTMIDWTYKQLILINKSGISLSYPEVSDDDIDEAMVIIKRFITEVNNDFKD